MATRKSAKPKSAGAAAITLDAELRIGSVAALHEALRASVETSGGVSVDASAVSVADTAAMQVLYVCSSECRARGIDWNWTGVSDALREASRLLGMDSTLDLPAQPAR